MLKRGTNKDVHIVNNTVAAPQDPFLVSNGTPREYPRRVLASKVVIYATRYHAFPSPCCRLKSTTRRSGRGGRSTA